MKLELKNWTVTGYWPYSTILNRSVETGVTLRGVTPAFKTENLSDVYTILKANGEIPDPYYSNNSRACEWVSERWWLFENSFFIPEDWADKRWRLVIEGLDYEGDIHINGKFICHHKGPFIPLKTELDDYLEYGKENRLSITVYNTPDDYTQYGYTSKTSTQRSRFDYKWDFCTRIVGIGIYGPVYIEEICEVEITDAFVKPRFIQGENWEIPANLTVESRSQEEVSIKTELFYGNEAVVSEETAAKLQKGENNISAPLKVKSPLLWWPNKHGNQPLYTFSVTVLKNGAEICKKEYTVAFRTVEYRRADKSSEDSLPYVPVINGRPVYIKGVNLVPFDLVQKFPSKETYNEAFRMLSDANINLVRVWGGGILESEYFYNLCDRYGIMVWQEFIQSSSGVDNVPCKDPVFLELLSRTAEAMLKKRRNHTCLTFWSGGNELCSEDFINCNDRNDHPVTYDDANIAMLKGLVEKWDPDTFMLPSSASGPHSFLNNDNKGGNHDVHGPWMYYGERVHYERFNGSDSILHSEFGCNGMSDIETLKDCLPKENLTVKPPFSDYIWNHHGGDWWGTQKRDTEIFGSFGEDELETLIKCSQFIQAEGIRYSLQSNLRRAMQNCGSIIWQFNEPWPNIACTSLTSYPLRPKLAYFFTKAAFSSQYASLKYDRLCWNAGETFKAEAFGFNEFGKKEGTVRCEITDTNGTLLFEKEWQLEASLAATAGNIEWQIPENISGGFLVKAYWTEGDTALNEYLFLIKDKETGLCQKQVATDYVDKYLKG